ncbi:MAG: Gfo/Idh/MocA family oxidoreductase [Sedimentisphaerales bacterium]|nr:Gfo/Idh/MocA family oxidoreductase [Sedimentisphaerales bacterium]
MKQNPEKTLTSIPLSRRSFIKTAAGTLAFPSIVSSSVFGAGAPGNRLRIGCIGTGRMGSVNMNQVLHLGVDKEFDAHVVAVCDVDTNRLKNAADTVEKFYSEHSLKVKPQTFVDFRELLACKDIDGVIIATPDHQHAVNAIAAAHAGKDIYLQKPLTYSVVEGQKLVKAVRKNNVILQTGSQQRSSIYFRKTCELVRNGHLGKLQCIEVVIPTDSGTGISTPMDVPQNLNYDLWLGPTPLAPYTEDRVHPQNSFDRPGWLQIEHYCRGMITGWGSHMYDIAQWALGVDNDSGPVEVEATAEFPDRGLFDVHVGYQAWATYANGVKMVSHNGNPGVNFIGSDGWIWVERGSFRAHDRNIFRQEIAPDGIRLYESKDHIGNFLECMRSRKEPIAPVEAGHRSNSVCALHHIAMKLKRKLKWNPLAEQFIDDDEANQMLDFPHRPPWEV